MQSFIACPLWCSLVPGWPYKYLLFRVVTAKREFHIGNGKIRI